MRVAVVLALLAACGEMGNSDGARGPCAQGGQILEGCDQVETPEDACWKLVRCGVMPLDSEGQINWGGCLDRIDGMDADAAEAAVACIGAASCDQLTVNDSPDNPYEWPDCLEFP